MKLRTLIVEDEPPGRAALRHLLAAHPEVEVIGEAVDGYDALEAIARLAPDLLLLDVQLPGLDGFEVLARLEEAERPLVVFVTAYDQFALQAFRVHAVDYLLKPVAPGDLGAALSRVLARVQERQVARMADLLAEVEARRPLLRRFVIREGDRTRLLDLERVEAIEATGNYMHLYEGGRSHMVRETLASLESRLGDRFLRVHRSWMVAPAFVQELRGSTLVLQGGLEVPVSRGFRSEVQARLRGG